MTWDDNAPDINLSFRWGGKDGKWRWLSEAGDKARAGEERHLLRAMQEAVLSVDELIEPSPSPSSRSRMPSDAPLTARNSDV